jgi:hypothetical protein
VSCLSGLRPGGGVTAEQALTWNVGTSGRDAKGAAQVAVPQAPEYRGVSQGRTTP